MDGYVLDTHVLVWFLEGNPKLSSVCREILASHDVKLWIPTIAIIESIDLVQKKRTSIDLLGLEESLKREARVEIVPLDPAIAFLTASFESLPDIHDRCMVATTRVLADRGLQVSLMTADQAISSSGFVSTTW